MAKIVLRQEAIDDLNTIWVYTYEHWSEEQADKYYESLQFACKQIGILPELGKLYEEIQSDLLGFRTGKHIIFYRVVSQEEVEIIRILHERMDLKTRIGEQ